MDYPASVQLRTPHSVHESAAAANCGEHHPNFQRPANQSLLQPSLLKRAHHRRYASLRFDPRDRNLFRNWHPLHLWKRNIRHNGAHMLPVAYHDTYLSTGRLVPSFLVSLPR